MEFLPLVIVAALIFAVPGALLGWISGLRLPWAVATSVPVSFGVFGLGSWIFGQLHIRYTPVSFLVLWLLFVVLAAAWRGGFLLVDRRRDRSRGESGPAPEDHPDESLSVRRWRNAVAASRRGGLLDPAWILPAAGVSVGIGLLLSHGMRFFRKVPHGLDNIVQGWDVHWHASMVRWFMEEGIGDPTRTGELRNIENANPMYYPSAWHVGAGLVGDVTGLSPIAAMNLTSIVLPGILLPLSVAMLAWKLVGRVGLTAQIAAGLGGIAVFGSPVLMWIGYYVGMWPYLAAMAASGVVLALFMHVPHRPVAVFAAALAFAGLVQTHPAPVTVVVMGLALWWLLYLVWAPTRHAETPAGKVLVRLRDVGWLALAGGLGGAVILPQLLSASGEGEEVSSWTAYEDITHAEAWTKAFTMHTRHVSEFPELNQTPLFLAAIVGGVALVVWRRNLWAPAFYFLSVALTANSLVLFETTWAQWLQPIGGLHYATAHRLIMPVAMLTLAMAAVGVAVLIRLLSLAPLATGTAWSRVSVAVSVLLALLAGWGTTVWATRGTVMQGAEWSINAPRTDDRMVSERDLRAFDWLAAQPGAYEGTVLGEPADGHGWMYAYNGLPSLMRHYLFPDTGQDSDTVMAYWHANLLGEGNHGDPAQANDVDKAVENLDVRFVFLSPGNFWEFQPPQLNLLEGLWDAAGVTPVYKDGEVAIFAVNRAFTDAELRGMRAPGNSPEDLPPLTTGADGRPVFHRPTKPDLGTGPDGTSSPETAVTVPPVDIPATRD